jgi:hypothetical protein
MNKCLKFIGLFSLCYTCIFVSNVKGNSKMFDIVLNKIDKIIEPLAPKIKKEYKDESTLIISYQTRKYLVYDVNMTGRYTEQATEQEGPDYKGFILSLNIQSGDTINQAVVPQTLRRPYWYTYLDITKIKNMDKQFYWSLSYGNATDKKIIDSLIKTIKSIEK